MRTFFVALVVFGLSVPALVAADKEEAKVIFADKLDAKLDKEWSWLREDSKAWRIGKEGLEIRALPGHGTERKNILLGPARPAKDEFIVEVFLDNQFTVQFEHAGIQCYIDERNWVGLVKEKVGKSDIVLTQVKDNKSKSASVGFEPRAVWLRMVLSGGKAIGMYRATDKDEWKKWASANCPPPANSGLGWPPAAVPRTPRTGPAFATSASSSWPSDNKPVEW
jgi:hypothetical protein